MKAAVPARLLKDAGTISLFPNIADDARTVGHAQTGYDASIKDQLV